MKLFLSLCLLAGVAFSSSIHYYGWQPNKEFVFRYESSVKANVPEIRREQKAGLKLTATVRVQTLQDYSLSVRFENSRFITLNGEERREEREEQIPEPFKMHLEQPFKVHMKRGVVESFYVQQDEPVAVTNIKKALLSNLNLDVVASRRSSIESNRIDVQQQQHHQQQQQQGVNPIDQTYFSVREQSLHGDCETSYTIHPMTQAQAQEIEEKIEEEEKERNVREHLQGGLSQGRQVCQGKQYFQITKTRDFDNCVERPVYQQWTGLKAKCDTTKTSCKDLMNHVSATNYIVCGRDMSDFVIRKSVTENTILANLAWNVDEKLFNRARVSLELLKEESFSSHMPMPSNHKEIKTLTFEYPEKTFSSSQSLSLSESQKKEEQQKTGLRPQLPKPDLTSRPKMLVPVRLDKDEIARQISEEMQKVAREIFESPESCSSKGDVAGHLSIMAKALRPLSLDELKHVEMIVLQGQQQSYQQRLRSLFYDVVSMIGTNPAVMYVKEKIQHSISIRQNGLGYSHQNEEFTPFMCSKLLQRTIRSLKTPTKPLLSELIKLVKDNLKQNQQQEQYLYTVGLLQVSNLLHKACINPSSRHVEYPARIYGEFCNENSQVVVDQWIPFLEQELENMSQQPQQVKMALISALGKLGHPKVVKSLAKIISEQQVKPMVRSIAVYSLKRAAKLNPVVVKPILLSIIDNPAEATEVRIAAVAVLPWAQPSTAELQKIAVRSWFEPSKQVASFIYSTFTSLATTETPMLKTVGQKVRPLINLVKPFKYGYQYSKNWDSSKFVEYLKMAVSQKYQVTNTRDSLFPSRFSKTIRIFGGAFEIIGPSYTVYTQGMDKWLDQFLYYTNQIPSSSNQVTEGLRMITEKLRIESRKTRTPEIFAQGRVVDFEADMYLDESKIISILDQVSEEIRSNPEYLNEEKHFDYTTALKIIDVEGLGPCDAGFPVYIESNLPIVLAIKGSAKLEKNQENIPNEVRTKLIPVMNMKFEANLGVISPFTAELVGAGLEMATHLTVPLDLSLKRQQPRQVSLTLKVPEQIQREFEVVHVYVKPYTVKKSLHKIQPVSKASDIKPILSGQPLKTADKEIGKALELSAQLKYESDNKFVDLYSYVKKIQQHNFFSLLNTFPLVSSIKYSSTKVLFNPQQSETKELSLSFSLSTAEKSQQTAGQVRLAVSEVDTELTAQDAHLIKDVCESNFKQNPMKMAECVAELTALEGVTFTMQEMCRMMPSAQCQKMVAICQRAKEICETQGGITSSTCAQNMNKCFHRIESLNLIHKTISQLGHESKVATVQMEAAIQSRYNKKSLKTGFSFGISQNPQSNQVKIVSDVEVKTPSQPIYEVRLTSEAQMPTVNNRWNKEALLEEALSLAFNGKIEYGYQQSTKKSIHMESNIVKSHEQKRAVRLSPEYKQCEEEEHLGSVLSPVCERLRHQAASVDKIQATLRLPNCVVQQPWFTQIGEAAKAYFLIQLQDEPSSEAPSDLQTLKLVANVSRVGEEAQLKALYNGRQYLIQNIRLPEVVQGLVPISMRNQLSYNLYQKFSRGQIPSSCTIEPQRVSTFDNKTYEYQINSCEHLLFKDCSNQFPVAVTTKALSQGSQQKQVKIYSGLTKIEMTPQQQQQQEIRIEANIDGQQQQIRVQPGQFVQKTHNGRVEVEIKRYQDNVYLVILPRESLWVLFDGKRVEISAPQMLRFKSCGICGDLNGENTADLKTPGKCIMSRPRFAAYSYMIQEPNCPGVPSQDKPQYEAEIQECVRERVIPTPLRHLAAKLSSEESLKTTGSPVKPLISEHLVDEKAKPTGKVCISKEKIQLCAKSSQLEVGQPKPVEVRRKRVQYVCFDKNTVNARQMVQRAKAGETLDAELMSRPVAYSKTEYEPTKCLKEPASSSSSRRL